MTANNFYVYLQERFPLPGVAFISISFALLALGLDDSTGADWLIKFIMFAVLFTALLLRQRVTDEFKDMQHDGKNYPDRPFQRGVINKSSLLVLLSVALIVELSMALLLSSTQNFGWYLLVFAYTLLMAKEFFIGKWLEAHFTIYFLLHEAIFLWIAIWIGAVLELPLNAATISWAVVFVFVMMSIEIARKFEIRRDKKGKIVNDTYTSVWGENTARSAVEMLVLGSGIALSYTEQSIVFALFAALVSLILNLTRPATAKLQLTVGLYVLIIAATGVLV